MREAVIVSAARTPIGKFQGALSPFTAPKLGAIAVREAVRRAGMEPDEVEECIMGCVLQAGLGQDPARQAAIHGGIPAESAALHGEPGLRLGPEGGGAGAQAIQMR